MRKKKIERDYENINVKILNGQLLFETDVCDFKNSSKLYCYIIYLMPVSIIFLILLSETGE